MQNIVHPAAAQAVDSQVLPVAKSQCEHQRTQTIEQQTIQSREQHNIQSSEQQGNKTNTLPIKQELKPSSDLKQPSEQQVKVVTALAPQVFDKASTPKTQDGDKKATVNNAASVERYLRQEMLERYAGQTEKLHKLRLGIIGAGGLGGLCALLLSNAGVGLLRIADADTIAIHNLHRQLLFTTQQVGLSKAQCAQEAILERSAEAVESFPYKVAADNFAEFASGLDLILDLTDDARSRLEISRLCLERRLNLFSAAVSGYTALFAMFEYADPLFIQQHGCYWCLTQGADINTKVGITGPQAATAASLASHIVLEFLSGNRQLSGKLLRLDLNTCSMFKLGLHRDAECPVCTQFLDKTCSK